ncbi:hypothetical protein GCM10027597_26040 [Saccharopolyspora tripterygii]
MAVVDEDASELEESEVDFGSSFVADTESFELVQPGERAFHDPPDDPETGAVIRVLAGKAWDDVPIYGMPPPSLITWCFEPSRGGPDRRARSPSLPSFQHPYMRTIHHARI